MGAGEDYKLLFLAWTGSKESTLEERIAYIRRWDPPFSWLDWVAWFLWPEDFSDETVEATDKHFDMMAELGFGSRADWARCFDVDPDVYPLDDDVSSRWQS